MRFTGKLTTVSMPSAMLLRNLSAISFSLHVARRKSVC
jgi:hypothetical protein